MSRRRWNAPKSLTPRRAFDLLVDVVMLADGTTEKYKLERVRDALKEHVKVGLERAKRRSKSRKKAPVVRLAGKAG